MWEEGRQKGGKGRVGVRVGGGRKGKLWLG